jgi:hypothetical protein
MKKYNKNVRIVILDTHTHIIFFFESSPNSHNAKCSAIAK